MSMFKSTIARAGLILVAIGAILFSGNANAQTMRIGHAIWVGFGPMYIAQDKGFFKKNGLDVELIPMEEASMRYAGLRGGRLDIVATSPDSALLQLKSKDDLKYAFTLDQSFGADGVVALKELKTLADLKGKSVGVMKGSISEYWLNYLMRSYGEGVTAKDLKLVDMTAGDAGAAFVAKKIDAAVTWEPWLSRANKTDHGHVIIDSKKTPGRLGDVLVMKTEYAKANPEKLRAFLKSWDEAIKFLRANPDEAHAIMAKGVGGWLKDPKTFGQVLTNVQFFDEQQIRANMGTKARPGPFRQIVADAIDIWSELGRLPVKSFTADDIIFYETLN